MDVGEGPAEAAHPVAQCGGSVLRRQPAEAAAHAAAVQQQAPDARHRPAVLAGGGLNTKLIPPSCLRPLYLLLLTLIYSFSCGPKLG